MSEVQCLLVLTTLKEEKIMAAQLYCEMNDLCRKCGRRSFLFLASVY